MVRSIRNGVNPMGPVTYEEEGLDGSIPIGITCTPVAALNGAYVN